MNLSTGEILKSDTSKVIIPISYLRDANAKLIERIYLIKVKAEQDSIIKLNKLYIEEQQYIIKDFQDKVYNLDKDLKDTNAELNRVNRNSKTLLGMAISGIIIAVAVVFLK